MFCGTGEPLFYEPWQRGFAHPTGDFILDAQPVCPMEDTGENSPLWQNLSIVPEIKAIIKPERVKPIAVKPKSKEVQLQDVSI